MIRRTSLTPPSSQTVPGVHATRRRFPRRELSERVRMRGGALEAAGWTLNVSVGGVRAVLEEPVALGAEVEVFVGGADGRPGRVVWVQHAPDGAIVGVAFLDELGGADERSGARSIGPASLAPVTAPARSGSMLRRGAERTPIPAPAAVARPPSQPAPPARHDDATRDSGYTMESIPPTLLSASRARS